MQPAKLLADEGTALKALATKAFVLVSELSAALP